MSYLKIRELLEQHLNSNAGGVAVAFENVPYSPVRGTPFQRASLIPAKTENPTVGAGFKRERGIFQVSLYYPLNAGAQPATARAEALLAAYARGTTFVDGTLRILIHESPFVSSSLIQEAWFMLPVSVPYVADIFG